VHRDVTALAALFATSGTLHLVRPRLFESIVPHRLPRKRELVYASGVGELLCAAGLLHPRTRGAAGWASVVLLLAVFPANVQMAVDARGSGCAAYRVGTLARLPLQLPLVRTAWRAARH
jgi:uncharacterized membrane protein